MRIIDFLNQNSGAITALATIVLVVTTIVYAVLTRRIARETERAADATQKAVSATQRASEGALLMNLLHEYSSDHFAEALSLISRGEQVGWEKKDAGYRVSGGAVGDTRQIYYARHRVWWFYKNAYSAYSCDLLS
jgi:hypothetical protein